MTGTDYKGRAKNAMQGRLGTLIVVGLIEAILMVVGQFIPVVGNLLILGPISVGAAFVFYHNSRGQSVEVGEMFWGFSKCFGESFLAGLLQGIFLFLWGCLCLVPAFIKMYSYSMTYYIMVREPGISANQAITKSRELMDGHKADLFFLHLSFIGWVLLGIVTCGLAFLYVNPYMRTAETEFFNDIYDAQAGRPIDGISKDAGFDQGPNGNMGYNYNGNGYNGNGYNAGNGYNGNGYNAGNGYNGNGYNAGNGYNGNAPYAGGNSVNNYNPQALPDNQYNPDGFDQNQYNPNELDQNK